MDTIHHYAAAAALVIAADSDPRTADRPKRSTRWLVYLAAIAVTGVGSTALAQQSNSTTAPPPTSSPARTAQLQEVTVTGTRIKQTTDFSTPTPTTVIDTQTMQNMGIVNIGQALNLSPANVSEFTPTAAPESPFYTGAYIPDLRGLNGFFNTRTLTLIDGHRIVPTNTSDSFDLNFIPQILVQRIDAVTGGASAAYGSGAIAGVINIILNRNLNGGKLDVDQYDTHYNDARDRHVAFAYGHGFFNNRFHFVVGAEWEKRDPAFCMQSGRPWCVANYGPYATQYSPAFVAQTAMGANLRYSAVTENGVLGIAGFNPAGPAAFTYSGTAIPATHQASNDGLGLIGYTANDAPFGGSNNAPGGMGEPLNLYTNLIAPVTRGVITAMFTAKLTRHTTFHLDLNWGKVEAKVPNPGLNFSYVPLGLDNAYLPAGAATEVNPTALNSSYYLGKDWNAQIPNSEFNNTTLKRISASFDGRFGQSSWTWQGHWEYGLVKNTEGEPTDFHADESAMALDSTTGPNGQPECRITAALAAHPNNPRAALLAAYNSAVPQYPGPFGAPELPAYLNAFATAYLTGFPPALSGAPQPLNPLTGLDVASTIALLGHNCVPLNPFGKQQLSTAAIHYVTGNLSLKLRQTQTVLSANATGNIFHGIGAGPFAMAVGYEWRQEITHNDFATCPPGQLSASAYQLCVAKTTDFTVQFGDPYGGDLGVNEAFLEFNFPLLRNRPFAHRFDIDVAGRISSYTNTALYAVSIPSGASGTATFPTWKATLSYEPVRGIRFRATESRDERAPSPRDLYYSQIFVPGSFFGSCTNANGTQTAPCNINLIGNVNLKPESANTTTFGIVLTPPQLPGLEFSADWFHIHLINGINGGSIGTAQTECATGHGAAACPGIIFNPYAYNAAGQPCSSGVSGPLYPGAGGVDCTGDSTLTGALAYQQLASATNILQENDPAYNGAFYDTRGIDFSLNYVWALPDGSTILLRALTTWVGEQAYQNYAGGPILNLLGQTGNNTSFIGLGDYQNAPRWRGNISVTWSKGPWSITPNMTWIGQGTLNNQGLACTEAELSIKTNPCNWVYNGFTVTGLTPAQTAHEAYMKAEAVGLLPIGVANHVPSYFLFGLNATYTFQNVLKGLQVYTQIHNLLNKAPPNASASNTAGGMNGTATTTNPVFFDQFGLAYRVGFRLKF